MTAVRQSHPKLGGLRKFAEKYFNSCNPCPRTTIANRH